MKQHVTHYIALDIIKSIYSSRGFGRTQQGPQHLSKLSNCRLEDDTNVPGTALLCHLLFVHVNLKAHQGEAVSQNTSGTQSNLCYDL